MLESSSLRYFVLTFPRHSIVPEKNNASRIFFPHEVWGKMFYYAPPVVSKSFFNHLLGPRHWCRTRPFVFSFFFPPSSFEAFLTLSLQDAREILIPKRISQFSGPLRLDMLQYTVAGPIQAAQNNTKCVHIRRAHQFFGKNFIQNC